MWKWGPCACPGGDAPLHQDEDKHKASASAASTLLPAPRQGVVPTHTLADKQQSS